MHSHNHHQTLLAKSLKLKVYEHDWIKQINDTGS